MNIPTLFLSNSRKLLLKFFTINFLNTFFGFSWKRLYRRNIA